MTNDWLEEGLLELQNLGVHDRHRPGSLLESGSQSKSLPAIHIAIVQEVRSILWSL